MREGCEFIAKDFAKKFYRSKQWLKCRKLAIIRADGLCEKERCESPGYIVHHIIELTPSNINDPSITLNLDLLEYVCKSCHDREHLHSDGTIDGLMFSADGSIIKKRIGRNDVDVVSLNSNEKIY